MMAANFSLSDSSSGAMDGCLESILWMGGMEMDEKEADHWLLKENCVGLEKTI